MKAWSSARSLVLILLIVVGNSVILTRIAPSLAGAGSAGVTLRFAPSDATVSPGTTFDVDVVLDKGQFERGISAVSLKIRYDPQIVRAITFAPTTVFLPAQEYVNADGGATTSLVVGARSCEDAQRVPEQLTIARVTFEAISAEGSSTRIDWIEAAAMSPVACGITDLQLQDWDGVSENVVREAQAAKVCVASHPGACVTPAALPSLALDPESGFRGESVEATMSGFLPNERVVLTWDRGKQKHKSGGKGKQRDRGNNDRGKKKRFVQVGSAVATREGLAVTEFTVERDAAKGMHNVEASGSSGSRAQQSFQVLLGRD